MHNRVFISYDSLTVGNSYILSNEESHHIIHVKRYSEGDEIFVSSLSGKSYKAKITKSSVPSEIVIREEIPHTASDMEIHVFFGLTKIKALELAVSKCAELGVSFFTPVLCERSVLRDLSENRKNRLNKLVQESVKQSGRMQVMKLDLSLLPFSEVFASIDWNSFDKTFFFLPSSQRKLRSDFHETACRKAAVWIGPEGDFSLPEISMIEEAGHEPFSLGHYVLKSDTAVIAAVSAVKAMWG